MCGWVVGWVASLNLSSKPHYSTCALHYTCYTVHYIAFLRQLPTGVEHGTESHGGRRRKRPFRIVAFSSISLARLHPAIPERASGASQRGVGGSRARQVWVPTETTAPASTPAPANGSELLSLPVSRSCPGMFWSWSGLVCSGLPG